MNRKAQIQIQFNWIFVIIIGVVLLGFFFSMIFSQTSANEKQVSATIARHFETIITSTNQKVGTVKTYKIPTTKIEFRCDDYQGIYEYKIGGVKAKDIKFEPIFSSKELKGGKSRNRIYTWTENWNIPYQIATFLYITDNREHFSFVLNGQKPNALEEELINNFAANMSISIINNSNGNFENVPQNSLNMNKYVYVILDSSSSGFSWPGVDGFVKVPHNKVRIILISPDSFNKEDFFDYGQVSILDYDEYNSWQNSTIQRRNSNTRSNVGTYIGKASLYAAIFSEDNKRYVCEMNKALHKLKIISEIQKYKILNENSSIDRNCRLYLIGNPAIEQLKGAIYFIEDMINNINGTNPNLNTIYQDIKMLKKKNNDVLIEAQCPPIY